jgi:hypothetical protein
LKSLFVPGYFATGIMRGRRLDGMCGGRRQMHSDKRASRARFVPFRVIIDIIRMAQGFVGSISRNVPPRSDGAISAWRSALSAASQMVGATRNDLRHSPRTRFRRTRMPPEVRFRTYGSAATFYRRVPAGTPGTTWTRIHSFINSTSSCLSHQSSGWVRQQTYLSHPPLDSVGHSDCSPV